MKITNNGISQTSVNPAQQTPGASPISPDASPAGATPESDAYTPSAEWVRLVDLVKQQPQVREDRVREVAQKMQSGAYFSADSAQKTADAMLHGLD